MCLPLRQGVTDVTVEIEQEIKSEALFSLARFAVNWTVSSSRGGFFLT